MSDADLLSCSEALRDCFKKITDGRRLDRGAFGLKARLIFSILRIKAPSCGSTEVKVLLSLVFKRFLYSVLVTKICLLA